MGTKKRKTTSKKRRTLKRVKRTVTRKVRQSPGLRWTLVAVAGISLAAVVRCGAPAPIPEGKAFRSDDMVRLIEDQGVATVEQMLELIPAYARQNYVFMEKSRSPQKGSATNPRAIVYSQDSKFIFAFNGGENLRGYEDIEVVEFDEKTETFQFRIFSEQGRGKPMTYSEKNPGDCLGCHSEPARPNWEAYPEWPGAWGSDQDLLLPDSTETQNLKAFLKTAKNHPRYGKLLGLDHYARTRHRPDGGDTEDGRLDFRMRHRPNARLTDELFILNAKRIAREVRQHERYQDMKWGLASVVLRCDHFERFLPQEPAADFTKAKFLGALPVLRPMSDFPGAKIVLPGGLRRKHLETHPFHNEDVARLRTIGAMFDLDVRNWNLAPGAAGKDNWRSSETKFSHVVEILQEVMRRDSDLKNWVIDDESPKALRAKFCGELDATAPRR